MSGMKAHTYGVTNTKHIRLRANLKNASKKGLDDDGDQGDDEAVAVVGVDEVVEVETTMLAMTSSWTKRSGKVIHSRTSPKDSLFDIVVAAVVVEEVDEELEKPKEDYAIDACK